MSSGPDVVPALPVFVRLKLQVCTPLRSGFATVGKTRTPRFCAPEPSSERIATVYDSTPLRSRWMLVM